MIYAITRQARKTKGPAMKFAAILLVACCASTTARQAYAQDVASDAAPAPAASSPDAGASTQNNSSLPQLTVRNPRYVIQREDVLVLNFPLTPELNQTVTVEPDGYINLQDAGSLHVQGLTVPELVIALKNAYAGTLHNPIVNVDLKDFRKPFFTVFGQVRKPGQYELRLDTTVTEAIAVAGGLSGSAKTEVLLFRRTPDQRFEVEKLNLKDILKGKNVNEDASVRPGDMIYVPDSALSTFRKYVPYSVDTGTYMTPNPF
jgi:polysaccharide biosynthesis/export protein